MTDDEMIDSVNNLLDRMGDKTLACVGIQERIPKKTKFKIICSECSFDEEMYPDEVFITTRGILQNRVKPCLCSRSPKLSSRQAVLVVNRLLKEMCNTHLNAISVQSINNCNMFTVECSICSLDKEMFPSGVFKISKSDLKDGCIPCGCSKLFKPNERQDILSTSRLLKNRGNTHLSVVGCISEFKKDRKFKVKCNLCDKDPELLPEIFTATKSSLKQGSVPCGCSPAYKWSKNQYEIIVERKLKKDNSTWVGWEKEGNYKCKDKFKWVCADGHNCCTPIDNFTHANQGCSICAHTGFNKGKPASLYVTRWSLPDKTPFIKIGITNHVKVSKRINQQARKTDYLPITIATVEGCGEDIWDLELDIKRRLGLGNGRGVDKCLMEDGYSECFFEGDGTKLTKVMEILSDYTNS